MGSLTFTNSSIQDLDGKVFIVTGGNSGVVSASSHFIALLWNHTQQPQASCLHKAGLLDMPHGLTIMLKSPRLGMGSICSTIQQEPALYPRAV
jgi:hypothetical protein